MNEVPVIKPEAGLLARIMLRIAFEKRLASWRRRLALISVLFVLALIASIPAWRAFQADLATSGFMQYLGLLFSDFSSVIHNWQDYGLSLLESLPAVSTAMVLIVLFAILLSIKFIRDYRRLISNKLYGRT